MKHEAATKLPEPVRQEAPPVALGGPNGEASTDERRLAVYRERLRRAPRFKITDSGTVTAVVEGQPRALVIASLLEATGCVDPDVSGALIAQSANTNTSAAADEKMQHAAAIMHGIGPRDELEGMI